MNIKLNYLIENMAKQKNKTKPSKKNNELKKMQFDKVLETLLNTPPKPKKKNKN